MVVPSEYGVSFCINLSQSRDTSEVWCMQFSNPLLLAFYGVPFPAYMSSPCHIEMILTERDQVVSRADSDEAPKKKVSKKKLAREKMKNRE